MSIVMSTGSVVNSTAQTVSLSQLISVSASANNPAYLVLNALDRNEYTAAASGSVGSFSGGGHSQALSSTSGDARQTGIVFHYDSTSGRYTNSTLGYLDQLSFTMSASIGDVTDLSLFATSSSSLASRYANDVVSLSQADASGYLGTVTLVTQHGASGAVPSQATPNGIAAVARSFVGSAWNMSGCWVLTSTIAAEAGASLPVQSTADIAGAAGGEWFVAYNGPSGSSGDWRSMVHTGDMIGFVTASGSGHITTCVSGSGNSAMLVDNITLEDSKGNVVNAANDGSANDIIIQAEHAASQEWAGVNAASVVIYRLDTPLVATASATVTLNGGSSTALSSLFSAADPAGRSLTGFQVYTASGKDQIAFGGRSVSATGAASAVSVGSLAGANLVRGADGSSDTVTVRAFNGSWWGDWTSISVTSAGAAAAAPSAPAAAQIGSGVGATQSVSAAVTSSTVSVYRFFDSEDGTHFFTSDTSERDSIITSRPDLAFEGVGLNAWTSNSASAAAIPVYRFFDTTDGTHFFTASASEKTSIQASRSDLTFEGVAFYEDATPQASDVAVYRFFDTLHGTHLFTASQSERASILASRPDLAPEGIAFYAPS